MPNDAIDVVIRQRDGQYVAGNGKIPRIGNRRGRHVVWRIHNETFAPIHVKIHNFAEIGGSSPGPCPVENFAGCSYDSRANGDPPIPGLPLRPGRSTSGSIRGKLARNASDHLYSYELFVSHHATGVGNAVDPELQIDDLNLLDHLKPIFVTVGVLGALALAYRWMKSGK